MDNFLRCFAKASYLQATADWHFHYAARVKWVPPGCLTPLRANFSLVPTPSGCNPPILGGASRSARRLLLPQHLVALP
jgi:hypothetical protein